MDWQKIVGHEHIIDSLQRMVKDENMPHALLFFGMKGIGKYLTARILAKALLCEKNDGPCGHCSSCNAFSHGVHPDFFVIKPDGKTVKMIKIEQIREMRLNISLAPYLADKRVIIIDNADTMNETAANGLLKTLEEPIGKVFFILVASNREKLLPTILSRCMQIYFAPLKKNQIRQILYKRGIAEETARSLCSLSGGSVEQALALYENGGLESRLSAFAFMQNIFKYTDEDIWKKTDDLSSFTKEKFSEWVFYLQMFWRDMIILQQKNNDVELYNSDIKNDLLKQSSFWDISCIFTAIEYADEVQKRLISNADLRLIIEAFMIKLRDLK
ncbi:DNA polymerase III subunit delta' [Pectinatus sottacetonis]|uniref:DNA polymerase III subunit delta' n=1 Tax=Pectinatus sottacetonis TaxID=1002795 RepID=UPI001E3732A2|nr:DNA polymerase III subunit delta' [Pectinatus sottacetonis]